MNPGLRRRGLSCIPQRSTSRTAGRRTFRSDATSARRALGIDVTRRRSRASMTRSKVPRPGRARRIGKPVECRRCPRNGIGRQGATLTSLGRETREGVAPAARRVRSPETSPRRNLGGSRRAVRGVVAVEPRPRGRAPRPLVRVLGASPPPQRTTRGVPGMDERSTARGGARVAAQACRASHPPRCRPRRGQPPLHPDTMHSGVRHVA